MRHPVNLRHHADTTTGERVADAASAIIGSWRFIIIQTVLVLIWVALNVVAVSLRWDVYPFVLLNLMFSVQAAYTGPILLLAGNRQAAKDRATLEHDYATNCKAEWLIETILAELLRNSEATLAILERGEPR